MTAPGPLSRFSLLSPERGKSSHDQIAAILGIELLQGRYPPDGLMPAEAALMGVAAALAARRRRPEDPVVLRKCLLQIGRKNHTRQSFSTADFDFHLAICAASGNPIIRSLASVIETALAASFTCSSPVDDPADHEASVNGHAAIVDAIAAGDEQRAAEGIRSVIRI